MNIETFRDKQLTLITIGFVLLTLLIAYVAHWLIERYDK